MSSQFCVFHLKEPGQVSKKWPQGHWSMATCLRSMVLVDLSHAQLDPSLERYQRYSGDKAYEFILSIICGLESPMLGETEILGQFKNFVKENQENFSSLMSDVIFSLLRDAKKIRTHYLQNLGCTSYGSLLRKHLKDSSGDLVLIGAGSLTRDILPWFAKASHRVRIFTRSPEKHTDIKAQYPQVEIYALQDLSSQEQAQVLVLAAPMESASIQKSLNIKNFKQIFDLRGESEKDPLPSHRTLRLKELFASIESNRKQATQVKNTAKQAIQKKAGRFHLQEKQRPFGWEDLWIYA